MIRRLRDDRGATLVEVLMAGVIMLLVLAASLLLFDAAADNHRSVEKHNEAQQTARTQTDRLARELRNLASPMCATVGAPALTSCAAQPLAVDLAEPYDFVFRVVDDERPDGSANATNVKRVRYCLDSADPADGRLYVQQQTWTSADPPPVPATDACPGPAWSGDEMVAGEIVNRLSAAPRPLFIFDSADTSRISHVRTDLYIDPEPDRRPAETRLTSGVFLRNQNRIPSADFTATANPANNQVILNGSLSEDPESMPLEYWWYMDGSATSIGQGVVLNHVPADGTHVYRLVVKDAAGLRSELTREVTV